MEVDTKATEEDSNTATSLNEDELLGEEEEEDTPAAVENGDKEEAEEDTAEDGNKKDVSSADEKGEKKDTSKTEDSPKKSKEEQVHKCGDCGAKFPVRHKLMRHINTNHNRRRTGDGPFTCDDCNVTYAFRSRYNKHKPFCPNRKERPYVCVECNAGFDEKLDFHDHIRVHNWPSFDP